MKEAKYRGRYKLTRDLADLLTKKRIIFDKDFQRLLKNIFEKKYQDNKFYYLEDKI